MIVTAELLERIVDLLATLHRDGDVIWRHDEAWVLYRLGIYRGGAWRAVHIEIGTA